MARRRSDGPRVVAHRGASVACPENTLAAFAEGLRRGADGLELDLQLTRDGVPVVYHDKTLRKLGGKGPICAHTLAELRELDAGAWFGRAHRGERIPTLDDVLRRFGRRADLLLEIKPHDEPPARVEALARAVSVAAYLRAKRRARILSFDPVVLRHVARIVPQLPRVRLVEKKPAARELARLLAEAEALCLPAREVDPDLGEAVRRRGAQLWVYRCDTGRTLTRALRSNVDGIITDRPDWLRAELADRE